MRSILIIEDDSELREVLQLTLTSAGYEVRTAVDGKDAEARFRSQAPDLVITDIYMPNKDGLEVIMELRASFPDTQIIAISGQVANKNMLPVASALGAVRTLRKPFLPAELLELVEGSLSSSN